MDRFLKATGIGSKRNVTSPTVKSPPSKSPSTKQLKQVQIDSDSDESENETRTTISDKNKLKKNNNNISSNNINNNNNNNNNQTINSPNLKPQLSNKSILSNSDTKSIKSNTNTNTNNNNNENDIDRQLKQLSTPVRNNNNNNNQINNRNDVKELKQTLSEKSIILEPQQSQSQPKIETEFKYESEKSVTNSSNNSIIIPNDPNHKLPVIIPAPIIVQNDNYKFEEKITQLEREVEQLKIQKKNLEKSIEHEKLSNHNFQKVIEENKLVIKKLESRVSELTQEEEEMRAELFSKYDEIHALEDSKNRLNAQYLETAKQLRNLETEAVNRKNLTSSNNSIPIIPLPPPPPEPQLQQQNNITNSKQLNSIQSDEMRELRHQLKENEEKLKFQKSLTESKQLMNMKLDGRNRELMEQNDHFKSLIANYRQEIHDKEKEINELNSKISHLNERFNGPHNIDKKKILELENENQKLSEKIIENDKIFEVKEEKARIQLVDAKAEVEFMRKLLTECESEIEVLEGILENESSEMTQILSYMKTNNEGLFRFLQSIIRHYQSNEKLLNNNNNNEINENINNDNNSGIDEKNLDINGSDTITSLNQNDDNNNNNVKTSISSTNISSTSILDIQDVIYLLDSGILTLKVKPGHRPLHQMLSNLKSNNKNEENITKNHSSPSKRKVNGIDSTLPSRPPPVSAGGKISLECTLHLLDFMDKYQLAGLSKHFKNIVEDTQSNNSISTEGTPQPFQKSPMKLGSSHNTRLSSSTLRKPPVMNTPYFESDNISSATQSTNQSSTVKGPEYVCFTINRGNGLPDEKWLEIVDSSTKLKYYFNPQTGITQWELPINTKSK